MKPRKKVGSGFNTKAIGDRDFFNSHPPSCFTEVRGRRFLARQLPRGASDWLIEGPRAAYSTQLRGYLTEYVQNV